MNVKKTTIIAEAGVNHNGDINLAFKLIDAAAEAGVDYVKFQTFKANNLVTKNAKKAKYQSVATDGEIGGQYEMLKNLELTAQEHEQLIEYCCRYDVKFLSTAFDMESFYLLEKLGIDFYKIPSGEITNLPYLQAIGRSGKEVVLSTGMSTMDEIGAAIKTLISSGVTMDILTVLHCNSEYPTPMTDVNLLAMKSIGDQFGVSYGYSDHTLGIEIPIAAAALGATVIEKHFTLDRDLEGPDQSASLEPDELKSMVNAIRNIDVALGDGNKMPTQSELQNRECVRKSLVASRKIVKGEFFTITNVTAKRPGSGISPMKLNELLGHVAPRDFDTDELIEW